MSESSKCCSVTRHTAREQAGEARIAYRFHPRFGEIVQIRRRLERGGVAFVVVHQPDGSFASLPAWMTEPAASHFEIAAAPHFSLEILRALRAEVDALLGFLSAESKPKEVDDDASSRGSAEPVRQENTKHRARAGAEKQTRKRRGGAAQRDRRRSRQQDKGGQQP